MTTYAPPVNRECSACGERFEEYPLTSGNTFGARFWTDGKRDAPMLPIYEWLVKCSFCTALLWIDEQKQVEITERHSALQGINERFKCAMPPNTPTISDYIGILAIGVENEEKERYIRLRAWWAGNDPRRGTNKPKPLSSTESENLRGLIPLLNEANDGDRLMKAEALRELGLFADAETLLCVPFEYNLTKAVSIIRDLNQKRVTTVQELNFD